MAEEGFITQFGLLLTQLRHTRRAVENIERNTARYASFNFAQLFEKGKKFMEPPLLNNALKVHIVNINDLAPGGGGLIEGLLGGIGRLFGGFIGGIVGGTASMVTLPTMLIETEAATRNFLEIMRIFSPPILKDKSADKTKKDSATKKETEPSFLQVLMKNLPRITETTESLTRLFQVAAEGPGTTPAKAKGPNEGKEQARTGNNILDTLEAIYRVLGRASHLVKGLIILIPILTGTFALFLARLDKIKLAILEMLQFVMRNVFLLRGAILVTVFDTASSAATLTAKIMDILAKNVHILLGAAFKLIDGMLKAALAAFGFVADGVKAVIDKLIPWIIDTLGQALIYIGNTPIFRHAFYLVRILPALMPSLVRLVRDRALDPYEKKKLDEAKGITVPKPLFPGGPTTVYLPPFPDLKAALVPKEGSPTLSMQVVAFGKTLQEDTGTIFNTIEGALKKIAGALNTRLFDKNYDELLGRVKSQATTLAKKLDPAVEKLRRQEELQKNKPLTELLAIANAYETWLTEKGGLDTIIDLLNAHFLHTTQPGPESLKTIQGQAVIAASGQMPLATIEIDKVTVMVKQPVKTEIRKEQKGAEDDASLYSRFKREAYKICQQGGEIYDDIYV